MGTLFGMLYIEYFLKIEIVIETSIMSYGFDNNDDISTMSRTPKFAQLSFTYCLSLYYTNLRNSCEFLNWF